MAIRHVLFVLLILALAACRPLEAPPADAPTPGPASSEPTSPPEVTDVPPATALPALTALPLPPASVVTVPPSAPPILGEVPADLLKKVEDDLESRTGVNRAQFVYVRAEAIEWNDGSLGCPQPGMNYTMALVPGYWVVVEAGGRPYDYRLRARGGFVLCEKPAP